MLKVDTKITALVLIDLQKGIVSRTVAPYTAKDIVEKSKSLAERFRAAGGIVVLVNVAFAKDLKDTLRQAVDQPNLPPATGYPADFSDIVDGLAKKDDIHITKRQWGAFYGTELDLQLRRRGITHLVLGGLVTNMGVESTARQAWEHGYSVAIIEDLVSGFTAEMHNFAVQHIFPKISRVTKYGDIIFSK